MEVRRCVGLGAREESYQTRGLTSSVIITCEGQWWVGILCTQEVYVYVLMVESCLGLYLRFLIGWLVYRSSQ